MTTTHQDSRRQSFLVYFNGIEIPAEQVSVTSGIWRIPEATITLAPDVMLTRLGKEDKIQVAIFYLDTYYGSQPEFRLLFDGELTGWGYRNSSGHRAMEFKAIGHAAILTQLFPYFMTNLDSMAAGITDHTKVGKGYAEYKDTMTVALLYRGLNIRGGEPIKKPFDFVENIFRALFGVSNAYINGSVTQYFFGKWARLTNFHNRWVASPYFEHEDMDPQTRPGATADGVFPILRAVQAESTIRAVGNMMQRIGNEGSFWALLKHVFSLVYYDVAINPAPAFASVDLKTSKILGEPEFNTAITDTTTGRFSKDPLKPNRLVTHITKPNLMFTIPPTCNVIYPSMLKTYGYSDNFATEPTRIYMTDKTLAELFAKNSEGITNFLLESQTIAFPPEVKAIMDLKKKAPMVAGHNLLVWPEEFFKGPVIISHTAPSWLFYISKHYSAFTKGASPDSPDGQTNHFIESTLYNLYAALEFYREKYSQKYGAVDTLFNPYVVAGFPGLILDHLDGGIPVTALVLSVTHTLGQGVSGTSIQYSFAQTLEELIADYKQQFKNAPPEADKFFQELVDQALKIQSDYHNQGEDPNQNATFNKLLNIIGKLREFIKTPSDIAPKHPLPDIKYRFQHKNRAEQYYAALFHRKIIKEDATLSADKEAATLPQDVVELTFSDTTQEELNLLPVDYKVTPKHKEYVEDSDKAMRYIARPICTLEEYIDFLGDRGRRNVNDRVAADDPVLGKGAHYYIRIAEYIEGPGTEPPRDSQGYYIGAPVADTRMAWSKRLLKYREKVYHDLYPHRS